MRFKEFLILERDEDFHKQPRWKPVKKKLPAHDQAKIDAKYDGKPVKIKLPVIGANEKTSEKEFTIDNTLEMRRKINGRTMRDLGQVPAMPHQRGAKAAYVIKPKHQGDEA